MINRTLYRREMKNSVKLLIIFSAIMAMYIAIIIAMFEPEMMALLDGYTKAMPELMAAVGMTNTATDLLGFMISYLYGFILLVIPMFFSILRGNGLIAKYTASGAMAYLLAAPVKRRSIAITQMAVLVSGILLLIVFASVLEILCAEHFFPNTLNISNCLMVNGGLLCLQLFIGGICFLASCLFSDTKYSLSLGAGLPALMFILQMLANTGDKAEALKYVTFFTLFDANGLAAGNQHAILSALVLLVGAMLLFGASVFIFCRKNFSV